MDGILFLFLAILTVVVSIKIAYYANIMDTETNISGTFIGGILLAGITSLPEVITCFTSIFINNPYMAVGDIIGSNIFNIFILASFNIFFLYKMFFNKISHRYLYINALIVYIYIVLIDFFSNVSGQVIFNIGLPTIIIIIFYFIYIFFLGKIAPKTIIEEDKKSVNNIKLKFTIMAVLMVIICVSLTLSADYLAFNHPNISSSMIGTFLIGITTSLPEVVSVYALIRLNSFNLAFANIIGSNMFNLLILALADIFYPSVIYIFNDDQVLTVAKITLYVNLILFIYIIKKKSLSKLTYVIPSVVIVLMYLYLWKIVIMG